MLFRRASNGQRTAEIAAAKRKRRRAAKAEGEEFDGYSGAPDGEFLDDRVREQLRSQLRDSRRGISSRLVTAGWTRRVAELDLEPLALPDRKHLAEAEPVAGPRDGLPLRVMDLGLEHHVDHYLDHVTQRTPERLLTKPKECRVLSLRSTTTDRPLARASGRS